MNPDLLTDAELASVARQLQERIETLPPQAVRFPVGTDLGRTVPLYTVRASAEVDGAGDERESLAGAVAHAGWWHQLIAPGGAHAGYARSWRGEDGAPTVHTLGVGPVAESVDRALEGEALDAGDRAWPRLVVVPFVYAYLLWTRERDRERLSPAYLQDIPFKERFERGRTYTPAEFLRITSGIRAARQRQARDLGTPEERLIP